MLAACDAVMIVVPAPTILMFPDTIVATAVFELVYVIGFVADVDEVAPGA